MSPAPGPPGPSGPPGPPSPLAEPDLELDCRGRPCPQPIIELGRRVGEVEVGQVLAVVAEDPAARYDVPAWCRMRGHQHLGHDLAADGVVRHHVRRLR